MAIKILTDGDTNQSVMYDDIEEYAFGPVFGEDEDPAKFLAWIKEDPRFMNVSIISLVDSWRKEIEENKAEASGEGVATVDAVEAGESIEHWSDCAVYNEPAFPSGECNCNWPNEA